MKYKADFKKVPAEMVPSDDECEHFYDSGECRYCGAKIDPNDDPRREPEYYEDR